MKQEPDSLPPESVFSEEFSLRQARQEVEEAQQVSRQLVAELERERAHLQAVMDQAPLGLIIVEAPTGKILLYNEESARLLGHPLLKSNSYIEYGQYHAIHEDGTPLQAREYPAAKALLSGEVVRNEHLLYQLSNGLLRHLSVSAAPVHNQQGDIISVVCTLYDISEQYELGRQKDEFINIISHELKTPLTTVKGSLQLAKRYLNKISAAETEKPTREGENFKHPRDLIERALSQLEVQKRLIDDLVDASRMQANKLQLSPKPSNIVDLVSGVVEDQRIVAPHRMIELQLPEERNMVMVVDEDRIGQVLNNYLTNAIKYSPPSQPIYVGITPGERTLRVWVKDKGPGLSPEDQTRVWERFYQVKGRHVQGIGGVNLGLGLYICRELIQLHGGTVGVESKEGEGACFWLELPYCMGNE
jgi:signal transduction histidine kinase